MRSLFVVAGASLAASLAGKWLADAFLTERVALFGEFAGLQYSLNPGVAFGIRLPGVLQSVFITIAVVFVCVIAVKSAATTVNRIAFGLVIGGALANVVDRLRDGVVTDFFQIGTFPVFNVADACITAGVMLLLLEMTGVFGRRKAP